MSPIEGAHVVSICGVLRMAGQNPVRTFLNTVFKNVKIHCYSEFLENMLLNFDSVMLFSISIF